MRDEASTRASLLVRLRDWRDQRSWAEFVEIYEPLIYRLARQKVLQDADAQETTQEVLLAVAAAIDRWEPDPSRGSFRGWLSRIARNLIINRLVRESRQPRGTGDTAVRHLLEERSDDEGETTRLFEQEYRRQLFHWSAQRVRHEVQQSTWEAFWQTSVEGRPIREVAEALGVTAGMIYVSRSRVIARIRNKIETCTEEHSDWAS